MLLCAWMEWLHIQRVRVIGIDVYGVALILTL